MSRQNVDDENTFKPLTGFDTNKDNRRNYTVPHQKKNDVYCVYVNYYTTEKLSQDNTQHETR